MKENNKIKEFFATSWAIDNKTSVYVMMVMIVLIGIMSYSRIPKEQFPDIVIPTILVSTPYPGTSPTDMENLVTRPIEKEAKGLTGVKKITSTSLQDFSTVVIEFNTGVAVEEAKQRVKDAVDKARTKLPNNLPTAPNVMQIDFSEIPIMYIQISGNYDLNRLKKYAEDVQDRIEQLKEITRADIIGALEREIQIDVDMFKLQATGVSFSDIERAVSSENLTISAGNISVQGMKRTVRVVGQFPTADELNKITLKTGSGGIVYLRDIAVIKDGFKEQESFSRLNGQNVISISIIKRTGENLLAASDKIKEIINKDLAKTFPKDLKLTITGDTSKFTRNTLDELINTIILGFILVTLVLMFFMGLKTAFFVGLSVPLSMCIAFMVMPTIGFSLNMIVMFGFIFALGIVVDDAIVVIENTHRIHKRVPDIKLAAKMAAGEVFKPILSGTLTTLAPFFPLAFWPGMVGRFMFYMPVTLIITLFASLFVAYIMNPVFAVDFMSKDDHIVFDKRRKKKLLQNSGLMVIAAVAFYVLSLTTMGNIISIFTVLYLFHNFVGSKLIHKFQDQIWPRFINMYERVLRRILIGKRPALVLFGTIFLLFFTLFLTGVVKPKVLFFPDNEPNSINVLIRMPVGTDQLITDSITKIIEKRVVQVIGKDSNIVESVIANVASGADDGMSFDRTTQSHKGKVTINFVEHYLRHGVNTSDFMMMIRDKITGIPGAQISVIKNKMGPPTGKPVNIEISGENMEDLIADASKFKKYLDSLRVPGVEELRSDFEDSKPEIVVELDRERMTREGLSTGQIGLELRTAIFGKDISKFKQDEDEFPIQLRYNAEQRSSIDQLMNLKISYRDMASGQFRQIPVSAVAQVKYTNSYGGIKRKNLKRVITLGSEVLSGYTANEVTKNITQIAATFPVHDGIKISLTGENEDQKESMNFLVFAMLIAVGLIFFILIAQFNSISKTLIILSEVFFSIIGVLLGIMIFGMSISVIMTGMGIVALGGIVVRNGILIVEFIDELKSRGYKTVEAIVEGGKTRITPVLLTATATILGLIPLAVGLNINFVTLFTELNPQIRLGGDNVAFWSNISWTIVFGLSFASFLTLILVPAMYLIAYKMKVKVKRRKSNRLSRKAQS
ncbi:MAG: efflux RND transporter permease subunit [Bacteroidota bacterium]